MSKETIPVTLLLTPHQMWRIETIIAQIGISFDDFIADYIDWHWSELVKDNQETLIKKGRYAFNKYGYNSFGFNADGIHFMTKMNKDPQGKTQDDEKHKYDEIFKY